MAQLFQLCPLLLKGQNLSTKSYLLSEKRVILILISQPFRYISICQPHWKIKSSVSGLYSVLFISLFSFATIFINFFEFETHVSLACKFSQTCFKLQIRYSSEYIPGSISIGNTANNFTIAEVLLTDLRVNPTYSKVNK